MGRVIFFDLIYSQKYVRCSNKKKNIISYFSSDFFFFSSWPFSNKNNFDKEPQFKLIKNTGCNKSFKSLWILKHLFQKQLPNIPRTYITRILYEKSHECIAIKKYVNGKSQIIGGCSFRLFKRQQIIELVFFAIKTRKQTKGYGSQLITFLKDYARFLGFKNIITCADNNAMNFFFKQGFSAIISSPTIFWAGFMKDYDDVFLMEYAISTQLNYLNIIYAIFLTIIESLNLLFFDKLFNSFSLNYQKKKIKSNVRSKKIFYFEKFISQPNINLNFIENIKTFLDKVKLKNFVFPFLEPCKTDYFFDKYYFNKVFNGLDLRTIEERLRSDYYNSWALFINDVRKMNKNCNLYNGLKHLSSENCSNLDALLKKLEEKFLTKRHKNS